MSSSGFVLLICLSVTSHGLNAVTEAGAASPAEPKSAAVSDPDLRSGARGQPGDRQPPGGQPGVVQPAAGQPASGRLAGFQQPPGERAAGQVTDGRMVEEQRKRAAQLQEAVGRLASSRFQERQAASQWLWRQGAEAESVLRQASNDDRPEVARRATVILDSFRYGIGPQVPPHRRLLLQQFRDGAWEQRSRVLQQLLSEQQGELAERLVQLETNRDARRAWLAQLLQDKTFQNRFQQPAEVAAWVDAVAADQTPAWRTMTTIQLLGNPALLGKFSSADPWSWLSQFVKRAESPVPAAELLKLLVGNEATMVYFVEQRRLPWLLELVAAQPAEEARGELLTALLASSRTGAAIAAQQQIEVVTQFVREQVGAAARGPLLAGWFAQPALAAPLLEQRGWEGTVTWLKEEPDAAARGQILGRFVVSSKVREFLARDQNWKKLTTLAQEESDMRARHEYLDVVLQHGLFHALNVETGLRELWRVVQQDADVSWRMTALTRLLTTQHVELLLADKADWEPLLVDLRRTGEPPSEAVRSQFLAVFIQAYRLRQWMFERGHFDELLKLARAEPELTRASYVVRLLSDATAQEHVLRHHKPLDLLEMAEDYRSLEARREYLSGLFANPWIMSALLDDGHFDATLARIQSETDPTAKAILFGSFLLTPAVQARYRERAQLETLLAFARQQTEVTARVEFLTRLVGNDAVLTGLLDQGQLDALLEVAKTEPQESQRLILLATCYAEPRILLKLVERGEGVETLQFLASLRDDQVRRQAIQRLIYNPQVVDAIVEAGHFSRLMKLASTEPFASWRAAQVAQILRASATAKVLDADENRQLLVQFLRNETDIVARDHLMLNLVSQVSVLRPLVRSGQFDELLGLANRAQPGNRERMLAQLLMAPPVLDLLTQEERLSIVFDVAKSTAQDDARRVYWQLLHAQPHVLQTLIQAGFCELLLLSALQESEPVARADRIGRVLAIDTGLRDLAHRNRLAWLFDYVQDEAPDRAQLACLLQLQNSGGSLEVLHAHGRIAAWVDTCLPLALTEPGRPLALALLNSPWTAPTLSQHQRGTELLGFALLSGSSREARMVLEHWLQMPLTRVKLLAPDLAPLVVKTLEKRLSDTDRKPVLEQLGQTSEGRQWLTETGKPEWLPQS